MASAKATGFEDGGPCNNVVVLILIFLPHFFLLFFQLKKDHIFYEY